MVAGRVGGGGWTLHFKEAMGLPLDELVSLPGGNWPVPTPATPTFGPLQVTACHALP